MNQFKVNTTAAADLDIKDIIVTFRNQDVDEAMIEFNLDYNDPLDAMFAVGSEITISNETGIFFRGTVQNPTSTGTPNSESRRVVAYNAWWKLSRIFYRYYYPYFRWDIFPDTYVIGGTSTHVKSFGGNSESLISLLLAQASTSVTKGEVDLGGLIIPSADVYDLSIADGIRNVLRWISGGVTCFDYSTNPPTLHVVYQGSSKLISVSKTVGTDFGNVQFTPRHDLIVPGVHLYYERSVSRQTRAFKERYPTGLTDTTTNESLLELAGEDIAGTYDAIGSLQKTIMLSGTKEEKIIDYTFVMDSRTINDIYNSDVYKRALWELGDPKYPVSFRTQSPTVSEFKWGFRTISKEGFSGTTDAQNNIKLLQRDTGVRYGETYIVSEPPVEALKADDFAAGLIICEVSLSAKFVLGSVTYTSELRLYGVDKRTVTMQPVNGEYRLRYLRTSGTYDAVPSGIASKLYLANQYLHNDGSISLPNVLAEIIAGLKRKLVILPDNVASVIQQASYTCSTATLTTSFGAPSHLGPQDLIQLSKANQP